MFLGVNMGSKLEEPWDPMAEDEATYNKGAKDQGTDGTPGSRKEAYHSPSLIPEPCTFPSHEPLWLSPPPCPN